MRYFWMLLLWASSSSSGGVICLPQASSGGAQFCPVEQHQANLPSLSTFQLLVAVIVFLSSALIPSFIFFFKFILFIYFWLHWVFVAVHGLSLVVASGGYSWFQCTGFSLQ